MTSVQAALTLAGANSVRALDTDTVLGELPLPATGLVRCLARRRGRQFDLQLQFRPVALSETGRQAAETYLQTVRAQVIAAGFEAGVAADQGVLWLGISGDLASPEAAVQSLVAIGRIACKALDALTRDEELASVYQGMQSISGQEHDGAPYGGGE
jgi:hypothetical protein